MNVKNIDPNDLYSSDGLIVNMNDETVIAEMRRRDVFNTFEEQKARAIKEENGENGPRVVVMKCWHNDRLNYYAFHYGNEQANDNGYMLTSFPVALARGLPHLIETADAEYKLNYSRVLLIDDPLINN